MKWAANGVTEEARDAGRAVGLLGFEGPGNHPARPLPAELLVDPEGAPQQVEVVVAEGGEFAEAESCLGGGENADPVAGVGGVGETLDLRDGEEAFLVAIVLGELDLPAWHASDQTVGDGYPKCPRQDLICLGDRAWGVALVLQVGNPASDLVWLYRTEGRQNLGRSRTNRPYSVKGEPRKPTLTATHTPPRASAPNARPTKRIGVRNR